VAKKSRKARAGARINSAPQKIEGKQSQPQSQSAAQKSAKQPVPAAINVLQPGHYDYVKSDLISVGIISAVLILILIVLTFIPGLRT
jgi:hypothetical protein